MFIWCLGSHDRLRLVVIRFLMVVVDAIKGRASAIKEARSPACLGTRFTLLGHWQDALVVINQTSTSYAVRN